MTASHPPAPHQGTPAEVFGVFLKLGLTSFGGPVAHLGYFRDELVTRRAWLSERAYGDLVTLCQFLPGPASSQVGFALGLARAGWAGALAAFVAFTLPSALLLLAFAQGAALLGGPVGAGVIDGLKIVAVAIVAQAVLGMARSFCADRAHAAIAVAAVAVLAVVPGPPGMIAAIVTGAVAGLWARRNALPPALDGALVVPVSARAGVAALASFAALLILLPLIAAFGQAWAVIDAFFRAGALVFGGGHVVLPLLEAEVVQRGWVSEAQFLAGYGAAQAVPGPLFTFAAYLGAVLAPVPNGLAGAALALGAVFLPGFLLLVGILPFWTRFRSLLVAQSLMQGANAAVVGVLGFALYQPVFNTAISDARAFALALACFVLLVAWRVPPWAVVIGGALGGVVLAVTP